MPTDSLISALENLRETYSQRQKATNSLLTALNDRNPCLCDRFDEPGAGSVTFVAGQVRSRWRIR